MAEAAGRAVSRGGDRERQREILSGRPARDAERNESRRGDARSRELAAEGDRKVASAGRDATLDQIVDRAVTVAERTQDFARIRTKLRGGFGLSLIGSLNKDRAVYRFDLTVPRVVDFHEGTCGAHLRIADDVFEHRQQRPLDVVMFELHAPIRKIPRLELRL